MDPFSIGALLLGAFLQNDAANEAANRQQREVRASQQRQTEARNKATQLVMAKADEFDPTARNQKQAELAQGLEAGYNEVAAAPAITAQGVQIGQGAGPSSNEYTAAQAQAKARNAASLHQLASILGRTGGAAQLRQGEAIGIGDTAGALGRVQTGANNVGQIDQIGIEAAGQPSVGQMMLGQALSGYGAGSLGVPGAAKGPNTTGSFARMDRGQANWL